MSKKSQKPLRASERSALAARQDPRGVRNQKAPRIGGYLVVERDDPTRSKRRVRVMARKGLWIVHRSIGVQGPGFSVTHVPTALAAVYGLTKPRALNAMRAFAALRGDWTFTDKKAMTAQQKKAGSRVKWTVEYRVDQQ